MTDQLLAVHQGIVYKCSEGPDGTVDLVAPPAITPSAEFERLEDGTFVHRLSRSLPEAVFTLRVDGLDHVDPILGYVAPDSDTVVTQHRHSLRVTKGFPRFPLLVNADEDVAPNTASAVTDLSIAVVAGAPQGWQRIEINCRAIGGRMVLVAKVTMEGDKVLHWSPPAIVGQWFHRLRMVSYRPGHETWCSARYQLNRGAPAVVEYDDEPGDGFEPGDYLDELRYLPRQAAAMPDWLTSQVLSGYQSEVENARTQQEQEEKPYSLLARVFDGIAPNQRPVAYRPAIASAERDSILSYLESCAVVLSSRGLSPDLLHPEREDKVPMAFLTDGKWVWSAAVAYYLREHNVPPAPDLVDHIRSVDYQVPRSVPRIAMGRASALAMDRPEPEATVRDDWDRAVFAIRDFAIRYQVSTRYYSLGEIKDEAWCLVREGDRYAAFWYWANEDRRELEHVFDVVSQAATFIIGQIYQNYPNLQREEGELIEAWEVLNQPSPPDPSLGDNFERFSYIHVTDFEVDQFGDTTSLMLYPPGTSFDQIVPPSAEVSPTPRRLRLTGQWQVLSCFTKSSGTQAYFLANPTGYYLKWGQIVEVPAAAASSDGGT